MRKHYSRVATRATLMLALLTLLTLPACVRSTANSSNAPTRRPPDEESVAPRTRTALERKSSKSKDKEATDSTEPDEPLDGPQKSGVMARIFNNAAAVPPYGWDGQMSKTTLKSGLVPIHLRATEALRNLGFTVNAEESRRQEKSGRVQGAKADKTSALILLEEKIPGET